jgi:hypothetical protein
MRLFGSVFDDVLYTIGEDPITLVANTTTDELWAVINMLALSKSQKYGDLLSSSGSAATNMLQAFNLQLRRVPAGL